MDKRSAETLERSPIVIGITGGSASGKTTIANHIMETLIDCCYLSMDNYYKPLKDKAILNDPELFKAYLLKANFDEPDAIRKDLFVKHLSSVKNGNSVRSPIYDHATTTVVDTKTIRPNKYIIVDGLFLLSIAEVKELLDVSIFIKSNDTIRLSRRVARDVKERGNTVDTIQEQYYTSVKPMYYKHIDPYKDDADYVYDNTNDGCLVELQNSVASLAFKILFDIEKQENPENPDKQEDSI